LTWSSTSSVFVQAARLQRKDGDRQLGLEDQVGQDHVFGRQAGGEHGRRKIAGDAFEDGAGFFDAHVQVTHGGS